MSILIEPLSNSGVFPENLDGKTPTAPGKPSTQEGIDDYYTDRYQRADRWYRQQLPYWNADAWQQEVLRCANTHTYGDDGWMDCLQDYWHRACEREDTALCVKDARDKLSRELGPREFTLTYSPAWFGDDELAKDAMRVAIDKLTRYYRDEINEFHAIGEYTEAGRAHVHCYYELAGGTKITDKNFKRAWPYWDARKKLGKGHQGGHHANVRSKSDFLGYIEKDLNTAWMNVHITSDAHNQTT